MYKRGLIIAIFMLLTSYTVYSFPIQKHLAEKKL